MCSDRLFSCNWALIPKCPKHNLRLPASGHLYGHPCYDPFTAVKKVSADQCHRL